MFIFSIALKYFRSGCKIQHKNWHRDYYIYIEGEKIMDSMNNLFYPDVNEYISRNLIILDAAGNVWEVYDDVLDLHL